ncbi:MAG TPA: homoserine kinase [Bacilli bacterium]|nr:homoserine kinase [Bacilli bacterium]
MSVRVRVPATSANLGPGFDVLGLSLSLYNILEFAERPGHSVRIEVSGEGVDEVPRTADYNLVYRGFARYFETRGRKPPGVWLHLNNNIPVTRGLGSSATAIVSGLCAAAALDGQPLSREELFDLAVQIEGHPDNVAPAIYGGIVVSGVYEEGESRRIHKLRFQPPEGLTCVVAVPQFLLSTGLARRVLPSEVSFAEAASNVRNVALLVGALAQGDLRQLTAILPDVLGDCLHQPYRLPLIKGGDKAMQAAREAGALAVAISGSGPSLIAFATENELAIGDAMRQAFARAGVSTRILQVKPETEGVHLL